MKKLKSRIIGVILLVVIVGMYVVFVPQIKAETTTEETTEELSCEQLVDRYGLRIENTQNPDEFKLIKDPIISCGGAVQSDASFKVISINGVADTSGKTLTKTNKSVTFKSGYLGPINGNQYYVSVTVQNLDNEAEKIEVRYTEEREAAGFGTVGKANPQWNTICATLKTNTGTGTEMESFYKKAIPYCWQSSVAVTYTDAELNSKIETITKLWVAYNNQNNVGNSDFNALYNEVLTKAKSKTSNFVLDPMSTTLNLKCAYDKVSTGSDEPKTYTNEYGDVISSLDYYLNKDYYYSEKTTIDGKVTYTYNFAPGNTVKDVQDVCERTCTEAVKVEYGPPVASKAGLCFEYKVKVTSYVKCTAKVIANEPKTFTSYCNPAPICYSVNGTLRTLEQAGPKEEYESCVNACDGGKYTESCSIKCYNQVYGSANKKLIINYEDALAAKTAMTTDTGMYSAADCLKDNGNYFGCYIYDGIAIKWYSLKNYEVQNTGNKEEAVFKKVTWNERYALGRWYIDRVYKQADGTYLDQWASNANYVRSNGGYDVTGIYYSCKDDAAACGRYVSDQDGVYRSNKNNTLCTDNCHWRYQGDKESLSGNTTGLCKKTENSVEGNDYLNPGTIEKDAKANQAAYEDAVRSCIGTATCSEHTAEFSISLNYDTDTGEKIKVNTITFPYESKSDKLNASKANNIADRSRSTILQYDGCYDNHQTKVNYYMTEWSFPGTYIHNKTGEISFTRPDVTDGWYYDDKKFCMPLDAESVNTKWWEWYKLGNTCYTDAAIQNELNGKTGTSNGYNITAQAKKFGYFGWNFDIKCFYALRNEICNVQENGCCGTNKKESNGVSNYTFRSVALDNLFPNASQEGVVDPDKREIGFNWTSKAMSLKNGAYEVNPTALINHIESTASTLHSSDATELDYKFYLTPASLAKIKQYNNNHDYASWDGTVEEKNGINVYKSNLFRNVGSGNKVLTDIGGAVIKVGEPGVNNENYIAYGG